MKTTSLLFLSLLAAASISVSATPLATAPRNAAPTDERREVREVAAFEELSVNMAAEVIVRQGSPQRVEVVADGADLSKIETVVENNRLRIRRPMEKGMGNWKLSGNDYSRHKVTVYVTMPVIKSLAVHSSGSLRAETPVQSPVLAVSVSGSGSLRVNLVAEKLTTDISGSGRITLSGSAATNALSISGSGHIQASELRTNESTARISGSGSCQLNAEKALEAHISGSGSVRYSGNAQVSSHVSGSGSVRKV